MEQANENQEGRIAHAHGQEIRLDAISVKHALKATCNAKYPVTKSIVRILWKIAKKEILRIHKQKGEMAIHFMEMMAYIEDDEFVFSSSRGVSNDIIDFESVLKILSSWNLVTLGDDLKFNYYGPVSGKIRFHSLTLMKFIIEENKSKEKSLIKDWIKILQCFVYSNDHYYRIWSLASNYDDLLPWFQPDGLYLRDENSKKPICALNSRDRALFDIIIAKFIKRYGEAHERTIPLKAFEINLAWASVQISPQLKWKKWEGDGYRRLFDEYLDTHEREDHSYEYYPVMTGAMALVWVAHFMFHIAAKGPRPRTEFEDKFLVEAVRFAGRMVRLEFINAYRSTCLLTEILKFAQEARKESDIPKFLRDWLVVIRRGSYGSTFGVNGQEICVMSKCLDLALADDPCVDSSVRISILTELSAVTQFVCEERFLYYINSGLYTVFPFQESYIRIALFHVKCLQRLEKFKQVIEFVKESKAIQEEVLWKPRPTLTPNGKERAELDILEIEKILLQCTLSYENRKSENYD